MDDSASLPISKRNDSRKNTETNDGEKHELPSDDRCELNIKDEVRVSKHRSPDRVSVDRPEQDTLELNPRDLKRILARYAGDGRYANVFKPEERDLQPAKALSRTSKEYTRKTTTQHMETGEAFDLGRRGLRHKHVTRCELDRYCYQLRKTEGGVILI